MTGTAGAPAPEPPELLHDLLERQQESSRIALQDTWGATVTFAQMHARARRVAARLRAAGLTPGDRCALLMPKGVAECWAVFGVSMAGGVLVPLNPLLKAPQVAHICADCEPTVLLGDRKLLDAMAPALAELPGGGPRLLPMETGETRGEIRGDAAGEPPHQGRTLGTDLAAILYTSGSTGRPKGVMVTHANLLAGTRIVSRYLGIGPDDRILSILPLSFDYGLNQLLTSVARGACLVPFSFTFGDQLVGALARHEITGLAGVPPVWAILTQAAPKLRSTPLPALRYITNSGGPVPTATVARLREALPDTRIFLMYGLTEAFRSTYLDPDELDRRPGSIGKAIPECEVFVLGDDGQRAPPGVPGILVHRGPTVSRGYWRRPEDTARVLRPNPLRSAHEGPDIVCFSGDRVVADNEGFLFFVGRDDAMIKSAGYRISPSEVEEALMATGFFAQAAAIGLPDPVAGERVHAIVTLRDGVDGAAASADAMRACAAALPSYMLPRAIEIVAALPTTPNGKLDHKSLRAERVAQRGD